MSLFWMIAAGAASLPATPTVTAIAETQAVASARDAADDPAIWRNPRSPGKSLIVATDKKAGLNVYRLDGRQRSSFPAGRVNNVDLRTVRTGGHDTILVVASDRTDVTQAKLAMFELNPDTADLRALGSLPVAMGEAYGLCLYQPRRGLLFAFLVEKDGTIVQARVEPAPSPTVTVVRRMKLGTQSEGCVADDRTGQLYVAEENVGIWRFGARPEDPVAGALVAHADGRELVADAEGLALAKRGARGGWLVASSQGDSSYAVYSLPEIAYRGRFRIAPGATIDGTSETDGIEISTASFGKGRDGGILIAQDGDNAPEAQNFKVVRWKDVARALKLP